MGKLGGIRRGVIAAGIAVAKIEMKPIIATGLQMFGQPECIGKTVTLRNPHVESRATPPSEHVLFGNTAMLESPNRRAALSTLSVIVSAGCGQQWCGRTALAVVDR